MGATDADRVVTRAKLALLHPCKRPGLAPGPLPPARDITVRREEERHLVEPIGRAAQILPTQSLEVSGRSTGGVAHDFNSILMAMALSLELLEMDIPARSAASARLDDLKTIIRRAAELIGQQPLFAPKPEPGHPDPAGTTLEGGNKTNLLVEKDIL